MKKLLVAVMGLTGFFAAGMTQLSLEPEQGLLAVLHNDAAYVVIGDEAPALLASMKEIVHLTDSNDVVVNLRALIDELERGCVCACQEMMSDALDEAFDVLERHHARMSDEHLEKIIENLMNVWDRVYSEDYFEQESEDDAIVRSGCCKPKKSQSFCSISVQGLASVGDLNVSGIATFAENVIINGDETVAGDVGIGGTLDVAGATTLASLLVTGNAVINGTLTVGGVSFGDFYARGGNNFPGPSSALGLTSATTLNIITNSATRLSINSTGAMVVSPSTAGTTFTITGGTAGTAQKITAGAAQTALEITGSTAVAQTITAGTNNIGLSVQGNGTANAVEITAGSGAGGGLLITGGAGAGVPLQVTAAAGSGQVATFTGNGTAATAVTITPGTNKVGLTIGTSGTAEGLNVAQKAVVNSANTFPLFVGGTQTTAAAFTGVGVNTNNLGTPRTIWASITTLAAAISQSGGITNVTNPLVGSYVITFSGFGVLPVVVATALGSGLYVAVTSVTLTTATLEIKTDAGVSTDANFNVLIMGLAS